MIFIMVEDKATILWMVYEQREATRQFRDCGWKVSLHEEKSIRFQTLTPSEYGLLRITTPANPRHCFFQRSCARSRAPLPPVSVACIV